MIKLFESYYINMMNIIEFNGDSWETHPKGYIYFEEMNIYKNRLKTKLDKKLSKQKCSLL